MQNITKEAIKKITERDSKRICFADNKDSYLLRRENNQCYAIVKLPFRHGIEKNFPIKLYDDNYHDHKVYAYINSQEEYQKILTWFVQRENYIYLLNCLSLTVALGFTWNFAEKSHTEIYDLTYKAKFNNDKVAIAKLMKKIEKFIELHEIYKSSDYIMGVPSNKDYHLPGALAKELSNLYQIPDITCDFSFSGKKESLKI